MTRQPDEAGFTLIELIISLALFALIAMAGVALVESLLSIQRGTEGRIDRVAQIQRAMFVIDNDIGQIAAGPVVGEGPKLQFHRPVAAIGGVPVQVRYDLVGRALLRRFDGNGRHGSQLVLDGVGNLRWRYFTPATGWSDRWPPSPDQAGAWPVAIAAEMELTSGKGMEGPLRRVVALPVKP